jgi:predicted amidohydrolase
LERETFGHALIVDPWGQVEIDNNQSNSIQIMELSKEKIKTVRTQIPMAEHRRDSEMSETLKKISCVKN